MKKTYEQIMYENRLKDVEDSIISIYRTEDVQNYINALKEQEELNRNINKEIRKVQRNCKHDLVKVIDSCTDSHESRTYYKCKCIVCGFEEEGRDRDFLHMVENKLSYEENVKIYESHLELGTLHSYDIAKILNQK